MIFDWIDVEYSQLIKQLALVKNNCSMQFDTLNQLITSTVEDLFSNSESVVFQCKNKVKELETLTKPDNASRKNSTASSQNDSFELLSQDSKDINVSAKKQPEVIKYKSVAEWMEKEASKRLKQSFRKIGLEQALLKSNRKADLELFLDGKPSQALENQKKKVKNELKVYDNDFNACFKRQPNHEEKEPLRPLYVYYKKLKEAINKRGGEELSQEKIVSNIDNIKRERRELREKIEAYQHDFERQNNRKIRYVRDIAPIDTEYKRYKDLKAELQRYEELLTR